MTVTRTFLRPDDFAALVADTLGTDRRITGLDRLTGGSKKGVYRLHLDDSATVIAYVWSGAENYWPAADNVPDDPFSDANGAHLFVAAHDALAAAGVRAPRLLRLDREGRYLDSGADVALIEDVGDRKLEALLEGDPEGAAEPMAALAESLRRMRDARGDRYGRIADIGGGGDQRPAEDVIGDRALRHLDLAAIQDERIAAARDRIAEHVRTLREAVPARRDYGLVHGELGADHVIVTPAGEAVLIDIEGLTYFDVEWEHAFTEMRFGPAYPRLRVDDLDRNRLALYRYAQSLALVEGPLRLATTDYPDRDFMLAIAAHHIDRVLAAL